MAFKKNQGGRTKGSKNKITISQKKWMVAFLEGNQAKFAYIMSELEGLDFIYAYLKMCSIVMPKPTEEKAQTDEKKITMIKLTSGQEMPA